MKGQLRLDADSVLEFMQDHFAAYSGRADLASSDEMSLETTRTVGQARADPRRRTASIEMRITHKQRLLKKFTRPRGSHLCRNS
jgi:hypothetical protein